MKKTILLSLLLVVSLCVLGQNENRRLTISGQVLDSDLKEPMVQATVQLFLAADSTFVGGTVSDTRGVFSIEAPSNGTFRLKISSVGFQTLQREVTLRRYQNQELGRLLMSPEAIMLKEAVVTGRAAQVIVKKDTLVYNPEAYRTPEGSPIEELIKRMPGAEVDDDGNITMNGKQVKKILLDGKEFMLGDVETALKNLPVSIIQNVKFYDQQSDQARITGIEDGNKETVLDFTIKKGMNRGYMTNLDLAGGTQHRYASRGMGSSFTDKTRLVLMGNLNNKDENAGWWNRRGLNAISNLVRYNAETGGSLSRPENINGNWNADGGFNFNTALDSAAHWNIGSDSRLRYNNYVSYVAQARADAQQNTTRTTNLNQRLNLSFRNDWLEVMLDGNVNYQHSRNELQPNANLNTWRFSYGSQVMLRLLEGFEITTNLHENSLRGYNDPSSNTNELIWNGQVSKTFLKSKTLVVALNFYDLLGQQSNYERWVGATGRSDTRYNSINSYAMLHVRYRLNMFGGKVDTEGRYDKKWGNNDRRRW